MKLFAWEVLDTAPYAVLAMADGKENPIVCRCLQRGMDVQFICTAPV